MKDIQKEHAEWVRGVYPDQPAYIPAAGMVEEAGELLHCVLKLKQAELWGEEAHHHRLREKLADAIGDCAIYLVSYCNAVDWDFGALYKQSEVLDRTAENVDHILLTVAIVQEGVRHYDAVHRIGRKATRLHCAAAVEYLTLLRTLSKSYSLDFEWVVRHTWSTVRSRQRGKGRPKTVCLCGSTRFKQAFIEHNFRETMSGNIVLSVGFFAHSDTAYKCTDEEKRKLDELHKRKIDISDEVLVLNELALVCEKCGKLECGCDAGRTLMPYIGDSTRSEIEYAVKFGKPVRYSR